MTQDTAKAPVPRCPGTGLRTLRPVRYSGDEPDRCPVCKRVAYVRLDGTTGSHQS